MQETTPQSRMTPPNVKRIKKKSTTRKKNNGGEILGGCNERTQAASHMVDHGTQTVPNPVEGMQGEPKVEDDESESIAVLSKQNSLLKREVELLAINYEKKAHRRKGDIARLQQANLAMCQQLDLHNRLNSNQQGDPLGLVDQVAALKKELEDRETEIEQHLKQISYVEERLYSEKGLNSILKNLQTNYTSSTELSDGLSLLEAMTSRTAALFTQVMSEKSVTRYRKIPTKFPELNRLFSIGFGKIPRPLFRDSKRLLSTLLFCFIQEEIFHSECWKQLQFDGYMVKSYQEFLRNIGKSFSAHILRCVITEPRRSSSRDT